MSFPATRRALEDAGYKRSTYTRCQACMAAIEFWHTPQGRVIPMEADRKSTRLNSSHNQRSRMPSSA